MEYTTLGTTGMSVSRICLGCMSFGSDEWMLDEDESRELIERAIDLGINFFDTANVYSSGESEEILGNVLADYDRDEQVVATKVRWPGAKDHRNAEGLSRKTIEQEAAHSPRPARDGHRRPLPDPPVGLRYTNRDDAAGTRRRRSAGQVRHLGASSMWAHQFQDAIHTAEREGLCLGSRRCRTCTISPTGRKNARCSPL